MIDPHIHCAECQHPIATTIKCAGGKTKDVAVKAATQAHIRPGPQGPIVVPLQVPLCDECYARLEAAEKTASASRLIVPQIGLARKQ